MLGSGSPPLPPPPYAAERNRPVTSGGSFSRARAPLGPGFRAVGLRGRGSSRFVFHALFLFRKPRVSSSSSLLNLFPFSILSFSYYLFLRSSHPYLIPQLSPILILLPSFPFPHTSILHFFSSCLLSPGRPLPRPCKEANPLEQLCCSYQRLPAAIARNSNLGSRVNKGNYRSLT